MAALDSQHPAFYWITFNSDKLFRQLKKALRHIVIKPFSVKTSKRKYLFKTAEKSL
jgi:hypothetical protein